jgi:hypothetical protein
METKWQIGPVKLANGEEAFIDAINEGQEECRYTGRIRNPSNVGPYWVAAAWHLNGRYAGDLFLGVNNTRNLAPPPKKTVRVYRGMVVYANGSTCVFNLQAEAIAEARMYGFALIEIDREVTEGDGL